VFDSSTKFPEGALEGTFSHFGNFDECLKVNVDQEWGSFKGQHCLASVVVDLSSFASTEKVWYSLITAKAVTKKQTLDL
jgi:hypothetical protein